MQPTNSSPPGVPGSGFTLSCQRADSILGRQRIWQQNLYLQNHPNYLRDKTNWWAGWKECTNFIIVTCHEFELGRLLIAVAHPVSIRTKIIIQYPRRGRDPSRPTQPTKIVNKITKKFTENCFQSLCQNNQTIFPHSRSPYCWMVSLNHLVVFKLYAPGVEMLSTSQSFPRVGGL